MSAPRKLPLRLLALLVVLALVLAACGGGGKKAKKVGGTTAATTGEVPTGGTLVVGAEQEPDCFDWIGSCSGSSWGVWMAQSQSLPFAFVPVPTGTPGELRMEPGPVLVGAPELKTDPVETITYQIKPEAKWSDGVDITCDDFVYTADQQQNGNDVYDRTGYVDLDKVSCPDSKTAVVTYKAGTTFATYQVLFSANVGIFPSHLLKGKDRDAEMKDGYTWSGGPWFAKWNKGDSIELTPNPTYWDKKPKLDKVVFKFETDTAAEFQAFRSGQVQAIYPQPQIDVVDAISAGLPDANSAFNSKTAAVEALWFNVSHAPFTSKAVRQAVAYALDRDALVNKLFGKLGVKKAYNSLNPFVIRDYSDPNAFSRYHLDLAKVNDLMTGDGWAKGSDGVWAKGGERASFTINSTTGNKRRELTEQVVQDQLKTAGFDMKIDNKKSSDLFGEILPAGTYDVGLYAQNLTAVQPGLCSTLCSKNIPGPSNGNSGQNWQRVSIPELDPLLDAVDKSLDDSVRRSDAKQADDIIADNVVVLPLDPLPDILIWSKKVVGPVTDNSIFGMFWNINEWGLAR